MTDDQPSSTNIPPENRRQLIEINESDLLAAIHSEPMLAQRPENECQLFAHLIRLVLEGQSRMNLSAIRDPRAMVRHLVADAMALALAAEEFPVRRPAIQRAADIGTGAGFPLLPMAIIWPETHWTGIESVKKKAAFVEATAMALGLQNVEVVAERAEDIGRGSGREEFDLVTSRAVGPVSSLLEVGLPLLNEGGRLYLFKTEGALEEWRSCEEASKMLGGAAVGEYPYSLPDDEQARMIFVVEKVEPTPRAYPRPAGAPFKKPLVQKSEGGSPR